MLDRFERFSIFISEISRCWHKIASDEMEKYGLKGPYAVYLTTMYRYPEGITAAKLAEQCSRDKADVSRAVSVMESKGLIAKESAGRNMYRAMLKLTPMGRTAAEHVNERACLAVELGGRGISEEDRAVLYECLGQITANLRILSEEGMPQA